MCSRHYNNTVAARHFPRHQAVSQGFFLLNSIIYIEIGVNSHRVNHR